MIYYDHNYQNQSDTTSISPFFLRAIWLKNLWRLTFWFDLMTATGFGRKLGPAWRHLPLSGLFKVLSAHYPLTRIMAAWRVISLMISAWSLVSHIPCSPIPPVFLVIFFWDVDQDVDPFLLLAFLGPTLGNKITPSSCGLSFLAAASIISKPRLGAESFAGQSWNFLSNSMGWISKKPVKPGQRMVRFAMAASLFHPSNFMGDWPKTLTKPEVEQNIAESPPILHSNSPVVGIPVARPD